ncbi:hypothetical protein P9112_008332 [Eukaryota sp. TZLM1-RC]
MTDTRSVSRVFTRSCALNSLLTPAAVHQIWTDLPLVTEICHEASLLLQFFLLNFPLAFRVLVEQDGFANFPSHCRKVNRYESARAFRKWTCYQKDVKHLSPSEFNTNKLSSCCMAENIQAGLWQMRICTECQIVYYRDISAAKNIQIKKKAELWPERYICPDALLRR